MPLTTPFIDTEIETVREIVRIPNNSGNWADLSSRLNVNLNDAQATFTRSDITAWNKIKYGTTKSRGGIKGTDFDIERDRMLITNRVRERLHYATLAMPTDERDLTTLTLRMPSWSADESDFAR